MRWVCIAQEQPISENIADVLNSLQPISFSTSNFSATTIDYKETIYNSISHKMKFQWSIPNFQHKKKWYISLDYPKTLKLDRWNEKWASLGRRNPVRPESIGNKLGFGSNGPRTQVCSNAKSTRRVAIKWCRSQRPYSFSNHKNIYMRKFYPILFYYFKSYFINYTISFYNSSNILTFISLFYSLK